MKKLKENAKLAEWLRWFLLAAAIIVVYKSFDRLSDLLGWIGGIASVAMPLVWALIIAYFLSRPTALLERALRKIKKPKFFAKHARGLAVAVVYLLFIGLLIVLVWLLVPSLISSITSLFGNLNSYFSQATAFIEKYASQASFLPDLDIGTSIISWAKRLVSSIDVDLVVNSLQSVVDIGSTLLNITVTIMVAVYLLLEKDSLIAAAKRFMGLFLKQDKIVAVGDYLKRSDKVIYQYFVGQFIDCLLVAVLAIIALLVMGIPDAVLLGFIFGLFNIIPHFGPIIASVFVVFVMLMSSGFTATLWAFVVLLIIQQIDANIINPKILGNSLDMSEFWVMFALTVGGGLFGFVGMLIGVPVLAVIRMIYRDVLRYHSHKVAASSQTDEHTDSPESAADTERQPDNI